MVRRIGMAQVCICVQFEQCGSHCGWYSQRLGSILQSRKRALHIMVFFCLICLLRTAISCIVGLVLDLLAVVCHCCLQPAFPFPDALPFLKFASRQYLTATYCQYCRTRASQLYCRPVYLISLKSASLAISSEEKRSWRNKTALPSLQTHFRSQNWYSNVDGCSRELDYRMFISIAVPYGRGLEEVPRKARS